MSLLLGFGNKARHGKDGAAAAILSHVQDKNERLAHYYNQPAPIRAQQFRFAEALYEECRTLHGMTEKDAPLLQKVGADRRAENQNYWIDKVMIQVDAFFKKFPKGVAIITDVRYKNEAATIKSKSGYLINVTRLNEDGTPFVAPDRPADHPSEVELDEYNWNYYIRTKDGEQALAAEYAVTLYEFLRGLHDAY